MLRDFFKAVIGFSSAVIFLYTASMIFWHSEDVGESKFWFYVLAMVLSGAIVWKLNAKDSK